ncbi:MAG: LicD family protein [Treponema sp.]|nr:LicD family protein [Treponema sp.]
MTECERIVKDGILPENFFNEEVRCDFLVTKDRKKLFAVLLDILLKIDSVCKKHGIPYFIYGGTLLGAVRHGGFIPWDDDLDIVMFRKDYNKLLEYAAEFEPPYFLQTPYTDKGFFWANSTVRNKNTTAVTPYFAYQPMNHGAFVDIFTLDNIIDGEEGKENFLKINKLTIDNSTYMRMSNPNLDEENKKRVEEYKTRMRDPFEVYEEIQALSQRWNDIQTTHITTPMATFYGYEKKFYHSEDFSDSVLMKFEGYEFPAPRGWERILQTTYHDYMQMPPMEKRGLHHNILFDMDTPYQTYIDSHIKGNH